MSTPKKKVLGRGLSVLLSEPSAAALTAVSSADPGAKEAIGNISAVSIDSIVANPFQPRTHFEAAALQELADSIALLGIVQPLTGGRISGQQYQLISGERRWRAARSAGLTSVPVYVRLANDQEMLEMALVENIQRRDLDPIEIALSYRRLMDECQFTQEQCAQRVSKSRVMIAQYVGLLHLSPLVQAGLRDRMIDFGHARPLSSLDSTDDQDTLYLACVKDSWTVRRMELAIRHLREGVSADEITGKATPSAVPAAFQRISLALGTALGASVDVRPSKNGRGQVVIRFSSEEELLRLAERLGATDLD